MDRNRHAGGRDRRVGEALLAALDAVTGARVLLAGEVAGAVASAVSAAGRSVTRWSRRLGAAVAKERVAPWPPAGPFDCALLRLPRSVDELEMTAAAIAGRLAAGGRLIVAGGNDEGIRPVPERIARWFDGFEQLAALRHCRVIAARVRDGLGPETRDVAAWKRADTVDIAGTARPWAAYPGLFAGGRLDEGTALLSAHLPALRAHARVLDFAAGAGAVAAALRSRLPEARIDMIEPDSVALLAAAENAPGCRAILGASLAEASGRYDLVVSNPPIHDGKAEDHGVLEHLIAGAGRHVVAEGSLLLVVQRRVPLASRLAAAWREHDIVAESGGFRVWRASGSVEARRPAAGAGRRR